MNARLHTRSAAGQPPGGISGACRLRAAHQHNGLDAMFGTRNDLYRNFGIGFVLGAVIVAVHFFAAAPGLTL